MAARSDQVPDAPQGHPGCEKVGYACISGRKRKGISGVFEEKGRFYRFKDGTKIQITAGNSSFTWWKLDGDRLMKGRSEEQTLKIVDEERRKRDQFVQDLNAQPAQPPLAPPVMAITQVPSPPPMPVPAPSMSIGRKMDSANDSFCCIKFPIEGVPSTPGWKFELRLWKSQSTNAKPLSDELDPSKPMPNHTLITTHNVNAFVEINALHAETVYLFEVKATLLDANRVVREFNLPGCGRSTGRAPGNRCWNRTARLPRLAVTIPEDKREQAWDNFFLTSPEQDAQRYAVCLVAPDSVPRSQRILAEKPKSGENSWDAGHIIAGTFGGNTNDRLVRPENLIPEHPSTNRSHKAQNLIDYVVENQPQHLHEIACRLKLAYGNLCPDALDSLEFIWRVYHDGKGLGDGWDKSKGQIQTSYRDLRRAILTPPEPGKVRLEEADMLDFIQNKFDLLRIQDGAHWEMRGTKNPSLWPEDYDIATEADQLEFSRFRGDPADWPFFIFTLGRHRIKCQRPPPPAAP